MFFIAKQICNYGGTPFFFVSRKIGRSKPGEAFIATANEKIIITTATATAKKVIYFNDVWKVFLYRTRMYPMALIVLIPLSGPQCAASFPHVLESSGYPPVPNPILESQLEQSFCSLAT